MAHPSFWTEDGTLVHEAAKDRSEPPDTTSWPALPLHRPPRRTNEDLAARRVAWLLANQLAAATRAAGLQTVQDLHFQPIPSATLSPDVAVGRFPRAGQPPEIILVADVVPVGAAGRAPFYAAAGIDWYLVAEPDAVTGRAVTLRLLRREATTYARHTVAQPGQILTSRQPFPLAVSTTALVHPDPRR